MEPRSFFFVLAGLLIAASQVRASCKTDSDCSSSQCCGIDNHSFLNVLTRDVTRTCMSLMGEGSQCPASGVSVMNLMCGCQAGLVCYTAPSGAMPMYGRCISQAQYKVEQERIKNNPWLLMMPSANLG